MNRPHNVKPNLVILGQLSSELESWIEREFFTSKFHSEFDWINRVVAESVDAIVIRSPFKLTGADVERLRRLKLVVRAGTGIDDIDIHALGQHGVRFETCPGNAHAVAELVIGGLIAVKRDLVTHARCLAAGKWNKFSTLGAELSLDRIGILGYGNIGRDVANILIAFGAECVAIEHSNRFSEKYALAAGRGIRLTDDVDPLLPHLDVLVLTCPLTPITRGFISAERIALMRETAIIANVARGAVWDFDAAVDAVIMGRLGGIVCDVYAQEPPPIDSRLAHPRILATPHIGAQTFNAHRRIAERVKSLLDDFLDRIVKDDG